MKKSVIGYVIFSLIGSVFFNLEAKDNAAKHIGTVYNIQGPDAGAWSIPGDAPLRLEEDNLHKDLINTTRKSDPLPFFRKELKAINGTQFAKTKELEFDKAEYNAVKKLYKKHKHTNVIRNLKVGDVYLVRLRNSDDYAVIKITNIRDDGYSKLKNKGDNLDFISFEYRVFKYDTAPASAFIDSKPGIEKFENEYAGLEVVIYPNPVAEQLYVKFRKGNDNFGWYVMLENTKGDVIYTSNEIFGSDWDKNISQIPQGRYVLSIKKGDEIYLQKVIEKYDEITLSN